MFVAFVMLDLGGCQVFPSAIARESGKIQARRKTSVAQSPISSRSTSANPCAT